MKGYLEEKVGVKSGKIISMTSFPQANETFYAVLAPKIEGAYFKGFLSMSVYLYIDAISIRVEN